MRPLYAAILAASLVLAASLLLGGCAAGYLAATDSRDQDAMLGAYRLRVQKARYQQVVDSELADRRDSPEFTAWMVGESGRIGGEVRVLDEECLKRWGVPAERLPEKMDRSHRRRAAEILGDSP